MSETYDPVTQECSACGALIDITDEEPLALMHCPTCGVSLRVRRLFGNFEPMEVLGAGGMGAVYRAHDVSLGRSVALKLLRREYSQHPEITRQFEHEAAVTAHINHANVVKVYSTGTDHGVFYIAMEMVSQGSLDELMTLQGKVGEAQVLDVGIQIAQGLRAAYRQGLIHRDIKPGNILFADARHAKIVDFGLAAQIDDASKVGGEVWGTPYYVAPEKLEQPPTEDYRSDIYSLGATLFHAVAGRPPYEAKDASMVALKHLKSQPVSLATFAPEVSTRTAFVINKTLAKDPSQRQSSYDELIEQLEYARNQLLAKIQQHRVKTRVVLEDKGHQRALSVLTLIMLLAFGTGGYFVYHYRERLFPGHTGDGLSPGERARLAAGKVKPRYEEARAEIVDGKFAEAAINFRKLEADSKLAQPLLNWTTLHAGLGSMMAGNLEEGKKEFEKLAQREPMSQDPEDIKMSAFFKKLAAAVMAEEPQDADAASEYDRRSYEAIATLVLGVKNWELGEFESAIDILREFDFTAPEEPYVWIAEYKDRAANYEKSFADYRGFNEIAKAIVDPVKAKVELPKLKATLATLSLQGALAKKGRSTIRRVEQEIADYDHEQANLEEEMFASDEKSLAEVEAKLRPQVMLFKFDEAREGLSSAPAITDQGKEKKKGLINKYDWLSSFKVSLSQDLATTPFAGGLSRKSGAPIRGSVFDANEAELMVKSGETTVKVPWDEVSFESLIAMAQSYCRVDLPPDRLGDRLWAIGVYAAVQGKLPEATKYFGLAIQQKASYKKDLKIFPEVPPPA